jgi:hypothetical protein
MKMKILVMTPLMVMSPSSTKPILVMSFDFGFGFGLTDSGSSLIEIWGIECLSLHFA